MVLRLSLRISMRSTDMSLSVERFCAPCAQGRLNLALQTDYAELRVVFMTSILAYVWCPRKT